MGANGYETGTQKVIPAVLIYLRRGSEFLMLHRAGRTDGKEDFHLGRWNGLGGKLEISESPVEAARRETREEADLDLETSSFQVLGFLQFPNFKPHKNEDWWVTVLTAELPPSARPRLGRTEEGILSWVEATDVPTLPLWPGDVLFLSHVMQNQPFFGTIWYEKGEVVRHHVRPFVLGGRL